MINFTVEQRDAVNSLLDGNDVLDVLYTLFGKNSIFQFVIIAAEMERELLQTSLVVRFQQSIIDDMISEASNMSFRFISCRFIPGGVEICKISTIVRLS